jgi:hypothetical protein
MSRRELSRRAAVFLLVLACGWATWMAVGQRFSWVFCACSDAVLSPITFGTGGKVAIEFAGRPAAVPAAAESDASWNARPRLRVEGVSQEHAIRINPRRVGYLPLVLFSAFVLAVPLAARSRWICFSIGVPILLSFSIASLWVNAAWLFAQVPGLVYQLSAVQRGLLDFAYEGLVTPLGNRLILPLIVAAALYAWQARVAPRT